MRHKPLPYIKKVRAKGRDYLYFDTGRDVDGKCIYNRLPAFSDPAFGATYAGMLGARTKREGVAELPTVTAVSKQYELSDKFRKRSEGTQRTYLPYLDRLRDEIGNAPVSEVARKDIYALMDKMASTPAAANMILAVARNVFAFAMKRDLITTNPTDGVEENAGGEYEPWPDDLLHKALADESIRLPVALLYYTGQRIGDVCKMRWSDIEDGYIKVKQQKTGKELEILIHRDLKSILAETPRKAMTILSGPNGAARAPTVRVHLQRFAAAHGAKVVAHGLRKNAVNALLEAGCSVGETSSVSGQSLQMVEHYAKRRNTRKMGSAAILKWEGNAS